MHAQFNGQQGQVLILQQLAEPLALQAGAYVATQGQQSMLTGNGNSSQRLIVANGQLIGLASQNAAGQQQRGSLFEADYITAQKQLNALGNVTGNQLVYVPAAQLPSSGVAHPFATSSDQDEELMQLSLGTASQSNIGSSSFEDVTINSPLDPGTGTVFRGMTSSLYVKGLPPDANELFLYQRFAPYGAIVSCRCHVDNTTGKCKGVGFINFLDQRDAVRALHSLNGARMSSGHKLTITLQVPRAVRGPLVVPMQ